MTVQLPTIKAETLKKNQVDFQEILSDADLDALFAKHGVIDERKRKLFVRCFLAHDIFSG